MTLAQFKTLLQPGGILDSESRQVTINYNLIGSDYRVGAVAVRITGANLEQLQNATRITLRIPNAGVAISIPLQSALLPLRTVNREQVGSYYLYSIVEENQQPIIIAPSPSGTPSAEYYSAEVLIEPTIANSGFAGSEYDVLLNNATIDRQSEYIQISDRVQSSPSPRNIYSIITNVAIPASIQDSNYTSTPWIAGRYDGAKTDAITYGGVEPAIIGGSFKGAFFPQTYTEAQIRALAATDITYEEYFFTGKLDAPTCTIIPDSNTSAYGWIPVNVAETQTTFLISVYDGSIKLQPGDLITIQNGAFNIGIDEVCKVLSVSSKNSGGTSLEIQVIRGFGGSRTWSYTGDISYGTATAFVYYITSNQFYTLKTNRAQPLLAGKLYVRDSKELLYINAAGYSISGSKD